jgi:hypothetical protein
MQADFLGLSDMRIMQIPRFPRKLEAFDPDNFFRSRLSQSVVLWPDQAIALAGYMGWPNDPAARGGAMEMLRQWGNGSKAVPPGLGRIQHNWLRVADILSLHYDLVRGSHQKRRGGASIGKAIALAAAKIESRGAGIANLWTCWTAHKDVAHLVTAATLICAEARNRRRSEPFGLAPDQFIPFQMVMLMPDLVVAVALEFERHGLSNIPHARTEPILDPMRIWRIPTNINVVAVAPPHRKVAAQDLAILNARRAGNRGKANAPKASAPPVMSSVISSD